VKYQVIEPIKKLMKPHTHWRFKQYAGTKSNHIYSGQHTANQTLTRRVKEQSKIDTQITKQQL